MLRKIVDQETLFGLYFILEEGPFKIDGKYIYKKIFPQKSNSGIRYLFGNLTTGHFSGKIFSRCTPSGPTGSNDTGLMSV